MTTETHASIGQVDESFWPTNPDLLEQDVVRRAVAGDILAYGALCDYYIDRVYNFAFNVAGSVADAEAIVTRTLVRDRADITNHDPDLEPYRFRIFRLAAVEAQREPALPLRIFRKAVPVRYDPEFTAPWQSIDRHDRPVFALIYKSGFTPEEAAQVLGWDPDYVLELIDHYREELLTSG